MPDTHTCARQHHAATPQVEVEWPGDRAQCTTCGRTNRPRRIQLRRAKGWRQPFGAVTVARPTKWGNPFAYRARIGGLVREPGALTGGPWEYEGRIITGASARHDYHHPDGRVTECQVRDATRTELVELYRRALLREPDPAIAEAWGPSDSPLQVTVDDVRRELAGRDLACWCQPDQPCHADLLLAIANDRMPWHRRWYAQPDDLIGGWCVADVDRPPSTFTDPLPGAPPVAGRYIAAFTEEESARRVAALHNADLDRRRAHADLEAPAVDELADEVVDPAAAGLPPGFTEAPARCVVVGCRDCDALFGEDDDSGAITHFPDVAEAERVVDEAVAEDTWSRDADGVRCPGCTARWRCDRFGHDWSGWRLCQCEGRIPEHTAPMQSRACLRCSTYQSRPVAEINTEVAGGAPC